MIPIAEQERLLKRRAQRELEKRGFKLISSQGGGYQIRSAISDEVFAGDDFELDINTVAELAGISGNSTGANKQASLTAAEIARKRMIDRQSRIPDERDPTTKLPTPEFAAALEQMRTK